MIVFLDDSPERAALAYQRWPAKKSNSTIWVTTAQETIDILKEYKDIEEVHLDHDLGGEIDVHSERDDCGMEVVRWLEDTSLSKFNSTEFIIHSWNMHAAKEMKARLQKLGLKVRIHPFGT
jgi:hypothetical protein